MPAGTGDLNRGLKRAAGVFSRLEAGDIAAGRLSARAEAMGIEAIRLLPTRGDFNDDLLAFGVDAMRTALRPQLAPEDVDRLISFPAPAS